MVIECVMDYTQALLSNSETVVTHGDKKKTQHEILLLHESNLGAFQA